jgi:hypothetical protein
MSTLRTRRQALAGTGTLALASLGLVAVAASGAEPPKERHPHIHAAIRELREAKRDLEKADHDFGGHRVEAIKAIDHAIVQLEKALRADAK